MAISTNVTCSFDRHELERALRQSLEEERLREREKPAKKSNKPKGEKVGIFPSYYFVFLYEFANLRVP